MPKISIKLSSGSDDRYAIPNTIQKKQIYEEEERRELRITDSLMDDETSEDSDSGDDGDNKPGYKDYQSSSSISSHHMNDITNCNLTKEDSNNCQTTPLQHYNLVNDILCDKSTAIRNNTTVIDNTSNKTNLLDEEIANDKLSSPQPNEDLLDDWYV